MDTDKLIVEVNKLFWEKNYVEKFSNCEMRLLFHLLEMAVRRQDINDIPFNAASIAGLFNVNRKTVVAACTRLIERGLLRCTRLDASGGRRTVSLVDLENQNSNQKSSTSSINNNINIKDNNKDIYKNINNKVKKEAKVKTEAEPEKSLDELSETLRADNRWHEAMLETLAKEKPIESGEVARMIDEFIQNQRLAGVNARKESDLRSHCFNWIRYRLRNPQPSQTNRINNGYANNINTQQNGNNTTCQQLSRPTFHPRRGAEVRVATPEEYKTWF